MRLIALWDFFEGLLIEVAPAADLVLAGLLQFHVLEFGLIHVKPLGGGGSQLPWNVFCALTRGQLILHRHHVHPVAIAFLLFPARATNAQLFEKAAVELFELLLSSFINNDPVSPAAHDFVDGDFPGAQHPFTQQGNAYSPHHKRGEFSGFDVEGETEHPAELLARFGDHLAVDHPAVALG